MILRTMRVLLSFESTQVRSGMGAYAGAARRRVHLATVLPRPPSGHRPGRRQARHARILQIGLRLAIAQADDRPVMPILQIGLPWTQPRSMRTALRHGPTPRIQGPDWLFSKNSNREKLLPTFPCIRTIRFCDSIGYHSKSRVLYFGWR